MHFSSTGSGDLWLFLFILQNFGTKKVLEYQNIFPNDFKMNFILN